ncbi:hypothetical protein NDU88_004299 [Pleurodeles waltl]|uniref:Uncharacterized protein n=1 Tax=Pleurodeles waltl TaxID=8319 RepID=A0AAV7NMA4_PLEWA|nr:hypothetical protein NDU88_004299 [Pleurodeles waltl]
MAWQSPAGVVVLAMQDHQDPSPPSRLPQWRRLWVLEGGLADTGHIEKCANGEVAGSGTVTALATGKVRVHGGRVGKMVPVAVEAKEPLWCGEACLRKGVYM